MRRAGLVHKAAGLICFLLLFSFAACAKGETQQADTFSVEVLTGEHFTVTTQNPVQVESGGTAEFTISIDANFVFDEVSSGTFNAQTGTLTIENVSSDMKITFKVTETAPLTETYTVTVVNGTGGGEYNVGATVTLTPNPAPDGYRFKQWSVTGGAAGETNDEQQYIFTMPANAVTATALYEEIPVEYVPRGVENVRMDDGDVLDLFFDKSDTIIWDTRFDGMVGVGTYDEGGYVIVEFDDTVSAVTFYMQVKDYWVDRDKLISFSVSEDNQEGTYRDLGFSLDDVQSGVKEGEYYVFEYEVALNGGGFVRIDFDPIEENDYWNKYILNGYQSFGYYDITVEDGAGYSVTSTVPASLADIAYGEDVTLNLSLEENYWIRSVAAGDKTLFNGTDESGVIVFNTRDLTYTCEPIEITIVTEKISTVFTVSLTGEHFSASAESTTVSPREDAVFTDVEIEAGYSFASITDGRYDPATQTITVEDVTDDVCVVFTVKADNEIETGEFSLGTEEALAYLFDRSDNIAWNSNDGGLIGHRFEGDRYRAGYVVFQFADSVSRVDFGFMIKEYWVTNGKLPTIGVSPDNVSYTPLSLTAEDFADATKEGEYYKPKYSVVLGDNRFVRFDFTETEEKEADYYNVFNLREKFTAYGYYDISAASGEGYTVGSTDPVSLEDLFYGQQVTIEVTPQEGRRIVSAKLGGIDIMPYYENGAFVFTTEVCPELSSALVVTTEEIPEKITVTLAHDSDSKFSADTYSIDGVFGQAAVFTNVAIEEGYSFASVSGGIYDPEANTVTVENVTGDTTVLFVVKPDNIQSETFSMETEDCLDRMFDKSDNIINHNNEMTGISFVTTGPDGGYFVFQFDTAKVKSVKFKLREKKWWIDQNHAPLQCGISADNVTYTDIPVDVTQDGIMDGEHYERYLEIELNGNGFVKFEIPSFPETEQIWDTIYFLNCEVTVF